MTDALKLGKIAVDFGRYKDEFEVLVSREQVSFQKQKCPRLKVELVNNKGHYYKITSNVVMFNSDRQPEALYKETR